MIQLSTLFKELVSSNLIIDWAETLDWLFDDGKFSAKNGWNRGYTGQFAKKILKFEGFSKEETFITGAAKHLKFPLSGTKRKEPYVVLSERDGIAKDFVRHVRNGIAHGLTNTYKNNKGILYIEIIDYSDKDKENQSAYLAFPISYITKSHKAYQDVEKSIKNTKEKDRKVRGKKYA